MSKKDSKPNYQSSIWLEHAEDEDPFATKSCYCHGYDVIGEILPHASWSEYIYLLFKSERPNASQAFLFEKIALVVANPGMRDLSVRAAMNAGVGGSTAASSLIAALGVGAGQYGGAREVFSLVEQWRGNRNDLNKWKEFIASPNRNVSRIDVWEQYEHVPGFEPNATKCASVALQTLNYLSKISPNKNLTWLKENRPALEIMAEQPLSLSGIIACALHDLEFEPKQSEMLYLLLRLPGAAVHSLEQEKLGWQKFPFFGKETHLTDDPGSKEKPISRLNE